MGFKREYILISPLRLMNISLNIDADTRAFLGLYFRHALDEVE